jgi:type IV secretory pathway VirB10-like protein
MRIALAISLAVHVLMLLWLSLGPGARALDRTGEEPVMVDLVQPQDVAKEEPKEAKSEQSKLEQSKAEQNKPDPPRPDASEASNPPSAAELEAQKQEAEKLAAVRMARLLGQQVGPELSKGAPPADTKSSLTGEEITRFKAQIRKCWGAAAGAAGKPGTNVLIRIGLTQGGWVSDMLLVGGNGMFEANGQPSPAGAALVNQAGAALQHCQPYTGLPAEKYEDWQIVDMTFTARGPSGMAGETDQSLR